MADGHERVDQGAQPAAHAPVPESMPVPHSVAGHSLRLQATAGNQATLAFLQAAQPKLAVGAVDDPLEAEADRLADRVVEVLRSPATEPGPDGLAVHATSVGVGRVHEGPGMGAEGGEVGPEVERAISSARGRGQPLPDGVRQRMEGAFGTDLTDIRLHTGSEASTLNRKLQAKAFAVGTDIFFNGPAPDATTPSGQHLLAHELAHTVQQGGGLQRSPVTQTGESAVVAARSATSNRRQKQIVQRHSAGVLDKIATDLQERRPTIQGYEHPADKDLMAYIKGHVDEVAQLPSMVTVVDSKQGLIDALAIDLAARAGSPDVDADHRLAAKNDVDNGGGGFTALDGTVYMLNTANDSSALYHELIHVLSGVGGVTQLSVTKTNLNEGFTNYFAVKLAEEYKKTVFPAYPMATKWVTNFVAAYSEKDAYDAYFKDNEKHLYTTLGAKAKQKAKTADELLAKTPPEKAQLTKTEVGLFKKGAAFKSDDEVAEMVKKKIKSAQFIAADEPDLKWLEKYCGVSLA